MPDIEINIVRMSEKGTVTTPLKVPELSDQESLERKLLGSAIGIDAGHCLYLAMKYCDNFADRVKGYRVNLPEELDEEARRLLLQQPESTSISFYE